MSNTAIKVENLSKLYRLGEIGTGTISRDMERWFKTKVLKQEDPFLKIGETNDRANKGVSDIVYSLQDINFEIQQGDAVGIIGRNGAGKSTLLKILSRVTTPTTGRINIKGRVASLLEVGTGFHPELTGRENIYLNGAILGMRKREIDRKLDEITDFSGVERYIDTPVKRYSSGMYVRLAFAVAAHLESEILIVDEVLAVGDADFQKKCLGKMNEVSSLGGRTVLFVSHNMGSIKNLCKKTLLLKNGEIDFNGNVDDGIKKYLSVTVDSQENEQLESILNKNVDDLIVWRKIRLIQREMETREIYSDEEFHLLIGYQLKSYVSGFRLIVSLENKDETCLFRSFFDEPNNMGTKLAAGTYESKVIIPANLLIQGRYNLRVYATDSHVRMLRPLDGIACFFEVIETGYINRKQFSDDYKGLFTLPLNWETIKI